MPRCARSEATFPVTRSRGWRSWLNGRVLRYEPETRVDLFGTYNLPTRNGNYEIALNLRNLTREANISNVVPRVPLQGGVKADGSPYVFDGDREIMLGVTFTR